MSVDKNYCKFSRCLNTARYAFENSKRLQFSISFISDWKIYESSIEE